MREDLGDRDVPQLKLFNIKKRQTNKRDNGENNVSNPQHRKSGVKGWLGMTLPGSRA